jgi:hypothetical protein
MSEEGEVEEQLEFEGRPDKVGEWMIRGVLPVAPVDDTFNPDAPPTTGEEYLRLVRYQYEMLPSVQLPTEPITPTALTIESFGLGDQALGELWKITSEIKVPSPEWIDEFMKTFREGCLDDHVSDEAADFIEWPNFGDESGWKTFLYPNSQEELPGKRRRLEKDQELTLSQFEPDCLLEQRPSQRQIVQLLKFHIKWINDGITERNYQWIIRLLQCLDHRVTSGQVMQLRSLARTCLALRASEQGDDNAKLFYLNGILAVVGVAFGQKDILYRSMP